MGFIARYAYTISGALAGALWPFFRRRREIAIDNIIKCGVAANRDDAARIAKASWKHLAGHIGEALLVPHVITKENWREHLDTSDANPEAVRLLLDAPDTPILLVSAHHGVWEAATNMLSYARDMIAIARVMNSKFVANWLKKHHFRGRITVIDKNHGFTPAIMRQWKETNAAMTILMDQHTKKGARLRFFNRPARTFTTAARLGIRTGLPIVVGSFVRISPYHYKLVGGEPLRFTPDSDLEAATQLLNNRLEEAIRQFPEQYLWAHRRWRDD